MKPKSRYKKSKCCVYGEKVYAEDVKEKPQVYLLGNNVVIAHPMIEEAREKGKFFHVKTPFDWLIYGELENNFLWIWRFLFTWGWNGKKNTFSVSFYKADMETEVWSIGDY